MRPLFFTLVTLSILALVIPRSTARAHLDPPRPPALQEVTWLTVTVNDDMDFWGAGELSLIYKITQPGHAGVPAGRLPAAGIIKLSAPPAVALPGGPFVIYNQLNCDPLERPLTFEFTLIDDDLFWPDTSSLNVVVNRQQGGFGNFNREFGVNVNVASFFQVNLNPLCAGAIPPAEQPETPPPPPLPGQAG